MKRQFGKAKTSFFRSHWLILIAPLLAYPFMVNLRIFPFVAPNEEPKWAVLTACALWMGIAAAWLWFKRSEPLKFEKPTLSGILLAAYLLILGIGVFIGPNTTEGYIRFAFWVFCAGIFITSAWAIRHEPEWLNKLIWSLSIGSFIFSIRYWESYILDFGKPNYNIHVLFSPIGHVNFTGDVLIILLPALIWILATRSNPILRVLNLFSVTTVATILLLASSRGALGGLLLATLVVTTLAARHYPTWNQFEHKKQFAIPSLLVFASLLSSFIVYNELPYHYRDLARLSATADQTITGERKKVLTPNVEQPPFVKLWVELSPLLGARTNIYASATAMSLDAPLLGQGTGNFAWIYPSFSNRYPDFRDSLSSERTFTTNPHNVVLQVASQNGLVAVIIFMSLLLYFWYQLVKTSWHRWDGWMVAGAAAMTAAIFDAMFNHVFFNPASMFAFALLGGAWWGSLASTQTGQQVNIRSNVASIILLGFVALLCIWPIRWLFSEWNTGQAMINAKHPSLESSYYQAAYQWDNENFRAVFGAGQVAYKEKRYADSARYFEEFESFYPYNPPALNMLGAAYMTSGQFGKAERAFEKAIKIYPDFDMAKQNLQRVQMILKQQSLKKKK